MLLRYRLYPVTPTLSFEAFHEIFISFCPDALATGFKGILGFSWSIVDAEDSLLNPDSLPAVSYAFILYVYVVFGDNPVSVATVLITVFK